ncbi:MAG TPA: hypothetical protein VLE95_01335 [Chlamydiales bacterium]|nr:hypothetical protein [Chlamydiales bacterium]
MSSSNNTQSASQNAQSIMDGIEQQYQTYESWLNQIEADVNAINADAAKLPSVYHHHGWWIFTYVTVDHGAQNALTDDINAKKADIDKLTSQLAQAGEGSYRALAKALKSAVDDIDMSETNHSRRDGEADAANEVRLSDDLTHISQYIQQLATALEDKVQVEKDKAMIQYDTDNGLDSSSDVQKLISDSANEATQLDSFRTSLFSDLKDYNTQYNNADIDENGIHWYDKWFSDGNERAANDDQIKANVGKMSQLIGEINQDIIPELAAISPDFAQISNILDQILKRISELMDPNLTPDQRKTMAMSLSTQILSLFVIVMGLLDLVKQNAAADKSKNESRMSEATTASSQMGIANSQAQSAKLLEDLNYAAIMNKVMKIAQYALMAVTTLIVPGVGSFLVGAALIALQASGATDKLIAALTPLMGDTGAQWFVTALEMVVSMGGGLALDCVLKTVMTKILATISANLVREAVATAAKEAANVLAHQCIGVTAKTIEPIITEAAENAANLAAKKVFFMCLRNKNGAKMVWDLLMQTTRKSGSLALEKIMTPMMQKAAQAAFDDAAREAGNVLKELGRFAVNDAGVLSDDAAKLLIVVANDAANQGAASAMNITPELAKTAHVPSHENMNFQAVTRGELAGLYGALTNNEILVNFAKFMQDKVHKVSDSEFENWITALQVIQQFLASVVQMGAAGTGGTLSRALSGVGASQGLMKVSAGAQGLSMGTSAVSDYGMYETQTAEGGAMEELAKIQMVLNVLYQMIAPQIANRRKNEAQYDNAQFVEQMQNTSSMSSHLSDYLRLAGQVMIAG